MVDMAVTEPVLLLRYADVGAAIYASLRVVGQPQSTLTWVVDHHALAGGDELLTAALPDPAPGEQLSEAIERALSTGAFASPAAEQRLAELLGQQLLCPAAWQLVDEYSASCGATLFITPTARLARVPWTLLATPSGERLIERIDVLMAAPPSIANSPRRPACWEALGGRAPLVVLDPRVPGQRPDSALGSVLGRPDAGGSLARHFTELMGRREVLPEADAAVELFRRTDADRGWLAAHLARRPSRLLFVGHASAAEGDAGQAALHLAEAHPLSAADLMAARLSMPPRVALLACSSGGDYRFDEATGLVAAFLLGGAVLVTATLWSLPTTNGYRRFCGRLDDSADPMAEAVIAVDTAHQADDAGRALSVWQREQLSRWCAGDLNASPLYWAALATFTVDGAR
ncbi:MAG: CHAT domain-containing protein [Actinomycetota bacterium]|nr:CHAT domain-containing protein [Actinomycetota bacterium]